MAMAVSARAAIMFLFHQLAVSQFTLRRIRVVLLNSKFVAWLVARLIMFSILIVATVVVHCRKQLSSGVNVIHRTQVNLSQVSLVLRLHLHHRKCAQSVALPITIA